MSTLEQVWDTARARRDIALAKEIRLISATNAAIRRYFEAMGVTDWKRLTEGSWD